MSEIVCENYQNVNRDVNWANDIGKMAPVDLLEAGLPHLQFVKAKCYYLPGTAKRNAMK